MTKEQEGWLPDLPDDLDEYLASSEAKFDDITPGVEKAIEWTNTPGEQSDYSVVYIHGFSATRYEVSPLCEKVAAHLQANLFFTRLAGHGRSDEAMAEAELSDWLNDAREAYAIGKRLGKKVIVIANSTGSALATWMAATVADDSLAALVMLAPNFSPRDPKARMLLWPRPIATLLVRMIIGKNRSWEPSNELHGRYWTYRYPSTALIPMMQLVTLVESIDKKEIKVPVQMIYSPDDEVISEEAIHKAFESWGNRNKLLIPYRDADDPCQHIIAGDIVSPSATEPLYKMIREFLVTI